MLARRRWLVLLALLPLIVAGVYLADGVDSASDVDRARRYFRDSFQAGVMTERMAGELDRMGTPVAAAAFTELLGEENSRWVGAVHFWASSV